MVVDSVQVPDWLVDETGPPRTTRVHSLQRDLHKNRWIKRLWSGPTSSTLGHYNNYSDPDAIGLQTRIQNGPLRNIGEIGQIFNKDVYRWPWSGGETDIHVKTNLADPLVQQLFKYMTVFDPSMDGINNDGDLNPVDGSALVDEKFSLLSPTLTPEFEISGRININTAPWQVIAQLPWVSERLAQAIVAYRDKTAIMSSPDYTGGRSAAIGRAVREFSGFENIGELNNVIAGGQQYRIDRYVDGRDQWGYPDLTTGSRIRYDGSADDFEERDLIFSRISNLVTVRSDIFTAYILVRLGTDGPQKRVIAILDRSDVYPDSSGSGGTIGNVKVLALHPVPDPR